MNEMGFPHSEISGSKLVRQLPEAYRSHTTSFIVILCQGIHHTPLNFLIGNLRTTYKLYFSENIFYPYSIYPSSASKRPQWSKMRIKPSNILLKMREDVGLFFKKLSYSLKKKPPSRRYRYLKTKVSIPASL